LSTTSLALARTRFVIKVIIVVGFLLSAPFTPARGRFLVVVVYRFRRLSRWRSRNIARRNDNRCGFLRWRLCVNGLCGRSGNRCRRSLLDRWCSWSSQRGSLCGRRGYGSFGRVLLILKILELAFPLFELFVINVFLLN
jgi:hypothetical protein